MSPTVSLSGFPEFSPREELIEQFFIDRISTVFELHGFSRISTRAVEPVTQLEKKGETSKEIYLLSRLQDKSNADDTKRKLGLHFDLTVPFSRYILENRHNLNFPFRRYQIQKVWRGERPQDGRFREFTQADIDIVAADELPEHYEREIPLVMAEALGSLPIPTAIIHVNSRKVLQGALTSLGVEDYASVLQVIDKIDKIGSEAVGVSLQELGLSQSQAHTLLSLATISGPGIEPIARARALGIVSQLFDEGLADVERLISTAMQRGYDNVWADFKIARGLDYYTGMVYETFLSDAEEVGSICSGGRYDSLVADKKTVFPGVGMSIGITRLLSIAFANNWVQVSRDVPTAVLVALDTEDSIVESQMAAQSLRANGICTEVCPVAYKYGKQIRYAERRGIPYIYFPASAEIKDLRSGEQYPVVIEKWIPSKQDLSPQVEGTDEH